MTYIHVLIFALIQGAAELLPVSSSAHVIVAAKLMGYEDTSTPQFVFLLIMLHTGTMFAVLKYFWPRWHRLLFSNLDSPLPHVSRNQFLKMLALATVCTGILGLGLRFLIEKIVLERILGREKGEVEHLFKSLPLMAAALLAVGVYIILSGMVFTRRLARGDQSVNEITPGLSIWIGLVQGLCLPFRGFSRSGATISTALCGGMDRMLAEVFSFALAVVLTPPLIVYELYRLLRVGHEASDLNLFDMILPGLVGMVFSFISGLIALRVLSAALEKGRWQFFGYYCIVFSVVVAWAATKGY